MDELPFHSSEEVFLPGNAGLDGLLGDGTSSRPGDLGASQYRAGASGSVLLSQVLGAADMMGYKDVEVPALPVERFAARDPLRAAILGWISATGAVVPPEELAAQLARADAMPLPVQRDVALLLLSATEATLMQRAALAYLTPAELAWVYANPQIGEQLAQGIDTPETRIMALLAAKVDMRQSIQASLLLLHAVEATRGSLSKAQAGQAIDALAGADLDATTRAIVQLLATAQAPMSDQDKVMLAARLVALANDVAVPAAGPTPSFDAALDALLAQTTQAPQAEDLLAAKRRAAALPDDLEGAVSRLVLAQAQAVKASNPASMTPTSQAEALVALLVATAETLPTLEKYGLYWRNAPDALRMGEWDPSSRIGWAAHHSALLVTARGDIKDLATVMPLVNGHSMSIVAPLPERSFIDAYVAMSHEGGYEIGEQARVDVANAGDTLPPAVRDAAAILMTGAAESARLQREAFADLTPEEQRFLRFETRGLDELYAQASLSDADLQRLARATQLAARVDADKLAQAAVVAAMATAQAKVLLDGRDAYATQSTVTHVATGLKGLLARFLPIGAARAQGASGDCTTLFDADSNFRLLETCPGDDVLLRLFYPTVTAGMTPAEWNAFREMQSNFTTGFGGTTFAFPGASVSVPSTGQGQSWTCDDRECAAYFGGQSEVTHEMLVITGTEGRTYQPERTDRFVCAAVSQRWFTNTGSFVANAPFGACRMEEAARYGAATIHLDLGGHDVYHLPVGMVHINATIPVSLFLDVGGDEQYADPSALYDAHSPVLRDLGMRAGHPTQASAVYGGVAIMLDAQGSDIYEAPTRSQGFARIGFALLADLGATTDVYSGREFVQGASSETMSLGAAVFYDRNGDDDYTAVTGQGFGMGAVFLDTGGRDVYRNDKDPYGIPMVHLDVLPGGDIGALDERANSRVWLDGPGSLNVGVGIDQEAIPLGTGESDEDGYPDVVEFLLGTDPRRTEDSPATNPAARARALLLDTDGDGYPDYIERALSSDPASAASYPAGFPSSVAVNVPSSILTLVPKEVRDFLELGDDGRVVPSELLGGNTGSNLTGSDKVVDLRVPLQDAGTIDYGCTGEFYMNSTAPLGLFPGANILGIPGLNEPEDRTTGGPTRDPGDNSVRERCVFVSYQTSAPGSGNATMQSNATSGDRFTFSMPAGILAIGDVVATRYEADYFVVIDLGGADTFDNSAGGALLVRTQPTIKEGAPAQPSQQRMDNAFFAPSFVVNVDPRGLAGGTLEAGDSSDDAYVNATRDFSLGSYFGVLIDTAGNETYLARDASQGSLGGILLDLDGWDVYDARDLSQGAGLASSGLGTQPGSTGGSPARPVGDLPSGGNLPTDGNGNNRVAAHRRALPGMLLDMGETPSGLVQSFAARSHGQGFARGHAGASTNATNAPIAYGILASLGEGRDMYATKEGGRYTQGVAGPDGVGLLVDMAGADAYSARSLVSQGATISQTVGTNDPARGSAPHPGAGILVDLGGFDAYLWTDPLNKVVGGARTNARQDNLTIAMGESASTSSSGKLFADLGIHLDTESSDARAALGGIMGAGSRPVVGTDDEQAAFHVFMPTARLAIGKATNTTYDREFAFVVDLGGDNHYRHNAGGLIRQKVAEVAPGQGTFVSPTSAYAGSVGLFPVSLVVDGGQGNSTYTSASTFTQGAGFFGIGMVADLGGRDTFRSLPAYAANLSSAWVTIPPIIDGNIGSDWEGIAPRTIELRSLNDTRFARDWKMRLANDGTALYMTLEGKTTSADQDARLRDTLNITFDMGRRQQEWDSDANRSGLDQIRIGYDASRKCFAEDWSHQWTSVTSASIAKAWVPDAVQSGGLQVACRFTAEGDVVYEIRKNLALDVPYDIGDLAYCYDEAVGFGYASRNNTDCTYPATELGIHLKFGDCGAGFYADPAPGTCTNSIFTYPPRSVDEDGLAGNEMNGNLSDEMRHWSAVGLAQLGKDGVAPTIALAPALSQGVGLAGIGVVAMLGTGIAESRMHAGHQSLGYGNFGGLGILVDTIGSDLYEAGERSMGAAENRGLGMFIDLEGSDNYRPQAKALGWSPADPLAAGMGIFLDLGGDDEYRWRPGEHVAKVDNFRGVGQETDALPPQDGNNIYWAQNTSIGADYQVVDRMRQLAAGAALDVLHGGTRTYFYVTEYDAASVAKGESPWGNGCTARAVPPAPGSGAGSVADFRVRGRVCFVATVDTGNGNAYAIGKAAFPNPGTTEQALLAVLQDTTLGGRVDVRAVDFLVDRARVNSTMAKVDVSPSVSTWAAMVDLSEFPDGVARGLALPLFTAELDGGMGTYLFQDDVSHSSNEYNATPAGRTLLIDNPPRPSVGLAPAYTGIANATFSPSAVGAQQVLYVNYTVNHDVGEDRYAQLNGWRPAPASSNIPCKALPELPARDAQNVPLCNVLPFYLGKRGEPLTTMPGTEPVQSPARMETEAFDGSPYSAKTAVLETPLRVYLNESFHLSVPSRASLFPNQDYRTVVKVSLQRSDGAEARNADNTIWFLGYEDEVADKEMAQVEELGPAFGAAQTRFEEAMGTVNERMDSLQGNALRNQIGIVYAEQCGENKTAADDAKWRSQNCRQITGRPGLPGAFEPCVPTPPSALPGMLLWTAVNTVDPLVKTAADRKAVCHSYIRDLNATADTYGGIPSTATELVADLGQTAVEAVNDALDTAGISTLASAGQRIDGIHFNDIWFDANKELPAKDHCNANGQCVSFGSDGTLVIPAGFRIALEFGLVTGSGCPVDLCSAYRTIFGTAADKFLEGTDLLNASTPGVDTYNPLGLSSWRDGQDPFHTEVANRLRQQDGRSISSLSQGAAIPASFFFVKTGEPAEQPRLGIRVPAEPSTNVAVTIDEPAAGSPVATLRSGGPLVGDVAGTPSRAGQLNANYWSAANETAHANWTVDPAGMRWTQNTIKYAAEDLPDGLYLVNVTARDASEQAVSRTETLLVDGTAPLTFVTTDTFAGKATLVNNKIPVRWSVFEQGSGLSNVTLFYRVGESGDLSEGWIRVNESFPPTVRSWTNLSKAPSTDVYLFMTVALDRAGNVEGVKPTEEEPVPTFGDALRLAFQAKLALGPDSPQGYRRVFVDEGDPRFTNIGLEGGRLLNYQGSDFTFVRAGAPIAFEVCALDAESDIGLVRLALDHIVPGSTKPPTTVSFPATASGPCGAGGTRFVADGWSLVNADPAKFPEGIWIAMFEVYDRAGNRIRVPAGNIILDHRSPDVDLEPPVLPIGQSAVKPGDLVKIRLVATDDFGVDESGITVDASKFARNASALRTKPVRVGGVIFQEAQFTVDLPNLQNGVFEVVVKVPDLAGNATVVKAPIAVNFKPFEFVPGTLRVSNVTHNALTLHWKTNEPTSALAKFGTTSVALSGRTPQVLNVTSDHALRVEGLQPSTHYFLRAVAVSAGGFTKESELIEATTASALFLEPISPVAGDRVSGLVKVRFKGGLLDSTDFVSYTLEVRDSADDAKPWTFLTTATRQGNAHELSWNSTRYLDGSAYQLRLTAVAGLGAAADRTSVVIPRLTSDNTPPSVLVLSPLLATNDTTPLLTAEASDALSGLRSDPAQLLVDGAPVEGNLSIEPLSGGRVRITHQFDAPLAAGMRTFELRVTDRAGTVAREQWKVAIDGDAPVIQVNPTRYSPGVSAAKLGGTVTFNLTITDLSGVAHVVADASALAPQAAETRLVKLVNTNDWQGTLTVAAGDASATKRIPIRAVDLAGNERTAFVDVPVDNVAPKVSATSLAQVGHRRAALDVPADEPILVEGTATAPGSPPVTAATLEARTTARLVFDGLLPSRTYQFKVTAMDRAGNPVDLAGTFATADDVLPPSGIGDLSVLDLLNGTLRLSWAPATDDVLVSHYRVYRSDDGVTFQSIGETSETTYEDQNLPYERSYVYRVAAVDHGANEGASSPSLRASATAVPHLSVGIVTPTVGTASTTFRYTVTYLSPGGVPAAYVRIILDGVPQNMTMESGTASTGAVYVYETRLAPHKRDAPHTYAFEASDGRYTVSFPEGGEPIRGPLVSGDSLADVASSGFAAFAQRVPMGGVAAFALAMIAAVGIAALLRRKKEESK